ncbi:hypothetical protein BHU72_00955 [Desulfuribacillus stibiiarsenatis]|uniref:Dual OB-containing domain-containing protein n=1 Tax=Desulfuribacillus stibiiarsenatis TaxID=1390249 RepID=A0A1E5LA00_9FIRM|nr:hypothetical protein [Desulfuribacillus stibiiarsenatis]OEH86864.1 hypothetical protein BHU72_00955 [Desulfuribacillus stibiiarsenatis]
MKKEIIILTKSIKRNEYCVAGIEVSTGEWIRIVSNDRSSEYAILKKHMNYADGTEADIFDVVEVDFIKPVGTDIQPENWLLNDAIKWVKRRKSNVSEILQLHPFDTPSYIFYNTSNAITKREIDLNNHRSLLLVKVSNASVFIKTYERKRYSICFSYNGNSYKFISITDIPIRSKFNNKIDGFYNLGDNISVVFSLADEYKGQYYKIAAQIL